MNFISLSECSNHNGSTSEQFFRRDTVQKSVTLYYNRIQPCRKVFSFQSAVSDWDSTAAEETPREFKPKAETSGKTSKETKSKNSDKDKHEVYTVYTYIIIMHLLK